MKVEALYLLLLYLNRDKIMLTNKSPTFLGFLQATGLTIYILLIACFFQFVIPTFGESTPEFYAPIIMLMLFIMSAVITATLVLGRAGVLFWEKRYKEAFTLLFWTVGWIAVYWIIFLLLIIL